MSLKVLIVDDQETICTLVRSYFKYWWPDYQVTVAPDGIAALGKLYHQSFDLMMTDYNMPGMTGIQLIQEICQIVPAMKIVLMSARDTIELQAEVRRRTLKIDGYLSKPFSPDHFIQIVRPIVTGIELRNQSAGYSGQSYTMQPKTC